MKKGIIGLFLLILSLTAGAQKSGIINFDFEIQRPLTVLSLKPDGKDATVLKDGVEWRLKVQDFDTAGNIVTFYVYGPDGEEEAKKVWNDVLVADLTDEKGNQAYVVSHGDYIYLMLFQTDMKDGSKVWYARYCTTKN